MKKTLIGFAVVIGLGLSGCQYITFQGVKYRNGGAHSASLGSLGIVRTELNHIFEPQATPNWKNINVIKVAEFTSSYTTGYHIVGEVKRGELNNFTSKNDGNSTSSGIKHIFEIKDKSKLIAQINNNERLKKKLLSNKNYRIITSTMHVFSHSYSQNFSSKNSVDFKLNNNKVTGRANGYRGKTLDIADGTIIGYQYSRVCWKKDKAIMLLVDRPGPDSCKNAIKK